MHDQANHLRRLVSGRARPEEYRCGPRPYLAVLTGGKGGVGTTTIAVNLAVAVAAGGPKTVLVDADPRGGDAALLCGLEGRYTLADVLSRQRTFAEVLQVGPAAVRIIPGLRGLERLSDYPPNAGGRLLGQLEGLGGQADLVVVDAGNSLNRMMQPLWQAADVVLAVTTAEAPSVIDTYASIKAMVNGRRSGPIRAVVNRAPSAEVAEGVHGRLAQACRRFLAVQIRGAGQLPVDPMVAAAGEAGEPFVIAAPDCHAAGQIHRLAQALAGCLARTQFAVFSYRFTALQFQEIAKPRKKPKNDST